MEGVVVLNTSLALSNAFANRSVFISGHTGFKGSWLSSWLTVVHLAAQPLVFRSYQDPKTTFDTIIGGSVNLLESYSVEGAAG